MSVALCPHCQKKVQIPTGLAAGTVMQCASCNSQFLPPEVEEYDGLELKLKKKRKRRREAEGMSSNAKVLIGIVVAFLLAGGGLGAYFLMKPSHAKFNEVIVKQYQRYQSIMKESINANKINNLQSLLKQFQNVGTQLHPILKELESVGTPEDAQYIVNAFTSLVKSTERMSTMVAPDVLEKLKKKPGDAEAMQEMVQLLQSISSQQESLVNLQHKMAQKYGLLQIQPPSEETSFIPRVRQ